jgi:hypothetical protein
VRAGFVVVREVAAEDAELMAEPNQVG